MTNWIKHDDPQGEGGAFWTATIKVKDEVIVSIMVSIEDGKWGYQVTAYMERTVCENNNCSSRADAMIKAARAAADCLRTASDAALMLLGGTPKPVEWVG